jgi:hypothetical protein
MALLIMIFGVASALRTPTDIFPNIDIPVVSVVFSYTGLPPAASTHPGREHAEAHQSRLAPLALMIAAHCAISLTTNVLR